MDRIIALLAAFVGLIALGGAVLVHSRADTEQQRLAAEIASLRSTIAALDAPQPTESLSPAPAPVLTATADAGTADALLALQARIASLEETARVQADEIATAQLQLQAQPAATSGGETQVAEAAEPPPSREPAAIAADGPTTECIPLGTRFMGQAGDSFPICKTHAVINVAAVSDGMAVIEGAGSVAVGGVQPLETKGCTVTVFSADTSGYAELRVSCV